MQQLLELLVYPTDFLCFLFLNVFLKGMSEGKHWCHGPSIPVSQHS